jgi:hypothetical protein
MISNPNNNSNNDSNNNKPNKKPKIDNKWKEILGRSEINKHAHVIAIEQLNSGKVVTIEILNEILKYSNLSVTNIRLNILLNTPSVKIKNISDRRLTKNILKENLKLNT